jgi:amino acid transporter
MFRIGEYSSAWYAGMLIIMVTAVNIAGVRQGMWIQKFLTAAIIVGLLSVAGAGLILAAPSGPSGTASHPTLSGIGRAMIFVLFTYGGWNEVAYLSAEVHDTRRTIVRALMVSIGVVTAIYLIFNIALIKGLGLTAVAGSDAVAADLMRRMFGAGGARFISLLIVIAAASTMNGVVITGARTNYALGRDFALFSFMGRWREKGSTPVNALLLQGAIALALVTVGALSHNGFVMMVEYTAPVFWLFFFLAGVSLMVLRRSEPGTERPFRVPLYPAIPVLFCGFCLYMLHASLAYTGVGAVMGIVVLLVGAPLLRVKRGVIRHSDGCATPIGDPHDNPASG